MPGIVPLSGTAAERDAESAASGGGLSILCVDDHQDTLMMQKALLEMLGHRVSVAASGAEALQTAEQIRPDAALIDLGLGDMSGLELVARLRERSELADCLFVCISGQEEEDAQWRDAGFDVYLQKPLSVQRLREVLAGREHGGKDWRKAESSD